MTRDASHDRAPGDARGHRAAPRRAVPAHVSAGAARARASGFVRIDRPGTPTIPALVEHAVLTRASHAARHWRRRDSHRGARARRGRRCGARRRRRSSSMAPSRRSWTAARRRFSTRCGRAGVDGAARRGAVSYAPVGRSVSSTASRSTRRTRRTRSICRRVDRISASADRTPGVPLRGDARRVRARDGAGANVRVRSRGRRAAVARADSQGASTAERRRARRATVWSSTTLRWPDEFVRHKAMDCVGDLALAGRTSRAQRRRAQTESPRNGLAGSRDCTQAGRAKESTRDTESKRS